MKKKNKQKQGGSGVGDMGNKNDMEYGKCIQKLNPDVRLNGGVKKVSRNEVFIIFLRLFGVMNVKQAD